MEMISRSQVAIAGASGFVGRRLIGSFEGRRAVISLSRSGSEGKISSTVSNRQADFFSIDSVTQALQGVKTAVYLIHSMMPTAHLDQSRFEETDLWLADTFANAAKKAGVERIIFLGGIVPEGNKVSQHLLSRKEVEEALGSTDIPVVSLRAGLIVGAEGSSFQMLYLLVKRLPWMLCPKWAWTETQPISESDVVRLIEYCIDHPEIPPGAYDIGGTEVTTYLELMRECARILGVKRSFLNIAFFTPGLSTLWVCLVTGASKNLVSPLVRSLTHPMLVRNRTLLDQFGSSLETMSQALGRALSNAKPKLRQETRKRRQARSEDRWVRSIQRLPVNPDLKAATLAEHYFRWLEMMLFPWIRIEFKDQSRVQIGLKLFWRSWSLIELTREAGTGEADQEVYRVTGGALSKPQATNPSGRGKLEFRVAGNRTYSLVGLHDFSPRLPWQIYKYSQAVIHLAIMKAFSRFLKRRLATQ